MPRIRQYANRYAEEDFKREIFRKLTERYESVSVRALSRDTGISQTTLNTKIRHDNSNLDIGELQQIIAVLKPDPGVLLKLLGYSGKDITKFKNQKTEELT